MALTILFVFSTMSLSVTRALSRCFSASTSFLFSFFSHHSLVSGGVSSSGDDLLSLFDVWRQTRYLAQLWRSQFLITGRFPSLTPPIAKGLRCFLLGFIVILMMVEAVPMGFSEPHLWSQPTATTIIGRASSLKSIDRRIDVSHGTISYFDTLSPFLITANLFNDEGPQFPNGWGGHLRGLCGDRCMSGSVGLGPSLCVLSSQHLGNVTPVLALHVEDLLIVPLIPSLITPFSDSTHRFTMEPNKDPDATDIQESSGVSMELEDSTAFLMAAEVLDFEAMAALAPGIIAEAELSETVLSPPRNEDPPVGNQHSIKHRMDDDAEEFSGIPLPGSDDDGDSENNIQLFIYFAQRPVELDLLASDGSSSVGGASNPVCRILTIDSFRSVHFLRCRIAELMGTTDPVSNWNPEEMRLMFRGRQLDPRAIIEDVGLEDESSVQVLGRLRGGG